MLDGLRPFQEIPGLPHRSLLGAFWKQFQFHHDPLRYMQVLRERFGDLVRWEFPREAMLFAFGPEHNRLIYGKTDLFHNLPLTLAGPKGSSQTRLRKSIFKLNDREHHRMRCQILPPFQRSSLAAYQPTIVDLIRKTIRPWRAGERRNLHHDMHMLAWSIVRSVLYGLEENAATEDLYKRLEVWIFRRYSPWVNALPVNWPFTPHGRMLQDAEWLEQQFLHIMRTRRAEGAAGHDALSAILRFQNEDGTPIPDEDLVGHAATLYIAAYETTGNTLTWVLFLLAQHPHVLQDLLDELAPFQGDVPPLDRLEKLPLLNNVLKETMRLMPAVPYSRRMVTRDDAIGPYCLPRKTRVLFNIYMTHHMPELYPQPERFLPQRWETITPSPAEYLPFGMGKRMCLGASLSSFILKLALSIILPAWRITVVPNARIDRGVGLTLGLRNGLPVILAKQDRNLQASPVRGNIHEMVELAEKTGCSPDTSSGRRAA